MKVNKVVTIDYLDWQDEAEEWLKTKYGDKHIRDWGCKFHPTFVPENPYLDFWHWWLENIHEGLSNGSSLPFWFGDTNPEIKEGAPDWVKEIWEGFEATFPEEYKNQKVNLHYDW